MWKQSDQSDARAIHRPLKFPCVFPLQYMYAHHQLQTYSYYILNIHSFVNSNSNEHVDIVSPQEPDSNPDGCMIK